MRIIIAIITLLMILPPLASADTVYQCTNASGTTIFSDKRCGPNPEKKTVTGPASIGTNYAALKASKESVASYVSNQRYSRNMDKATTRLATLKSNLETELKNIDQRASHATNNLAGAAYLTSLANEKQAIVDKYNAEISHQQQLISRYRRAHNAPITPFLRHGAVAFDQGNKMATFRKRSGGWRAEVRRKGKYRSGTFPTKLRARAWATEVEAAIDAGTLGEESNLIVRDLFGRYSKECAAKHKGARWEQIRLDLLGKMAIADVPVALLSRRDVAEWRDQRAKQVSSASVRREMGLLGSVFSVAVDDWEVLPDNPVNRVRRPPAPPARDRRISASEIGALCAALAFDDKMPVKQKRQQTALAFLLSIETGMRAGEIVSLKWDKVHLADRFVELETTKNGDRRQVALSREAVRLLSLRIGETRPFDVTSASLSALFRKGKAVAGIKDLHFHDARHEAVTRLAQKLSILDLARMIGHRDLRSLQIYYNSTAQEIAKQLD